MVALLVIVTTDDGGPWARRVAMWAAVAPVLGALGTFATVRVAIARGEISALEALGVDPARAARGAAMGGVIAGALGVLVTASGWADLEALFPRPPDARAWTAGDDQALVEVTLGIRVDAGGDVTFVGEAAAQEERTAVSRSAKNATIATLGLAAFACPLWVVEGLAASSPAARRGKSWRRGIVALIAVAALIAAFQVVAAALASPLWLLASPLLLLADAAFMRYRATRAA